MAQDLPKRVSWLNAWCCMRDTPDLPDDFCSEKLQLFAKFIQNALYTNMSIFTTQRLFPLSTLGEHITIGVSRRFSVQCSKSDVFRVDGFCGIGAYRTFDDRPAVRKHGDLEFVTFKAQQEGIH